MQLLRQFRRSKWRRACSPAIVALIAMVMPHPAAAQKAAVPVSHIGPAAQTLLARSISALGGAAFLDSKTMTTAGRAFSIADGVTSGFVHYERDQEVPQKRRLSYGLGKKMVVALINDGDQGWEIDRYGVIEQSDKQIQTWKEANRYGLTNVLRRLLHEAGVLVQSGGQDFIENRPAALVDIIDSRQVDVRLYLDAQTYLPLRIAYRLPDAATHDWNDYDELYADYRKVQGVDTPMHLIRYVNGERTAETFRFQVRYNQTYPAVTFQAPR